MGILWKSDTFYFLGSKITADGDCSHEIKRCFLLGRKVMTNLDSILKRRDITFPTGVHLLKAMVFPVVMFDGESWTIKKSECQRIDAFELWCWGRLLTVPLTELNWIYDFSSHVRMWELDYKESWVLKNWCFWTVVLEKILESPSDYKEIQPAHPKGNQSWIFIGRTNAEAETAIIWPPDEKKWLPEKNPMLWKIEGRRRRWQRMRLLDGITDSMEFNI